MANQGPAYLLHWSSHMTKDGPIRLSSGHSEGKSMKQTHLMSLPKELVCSFLLPWSPGLLWHFLSIDLALHPSLAPGRNSSILLITHFLFLELIGVACHLCLNQNALLDILRHFVLGMDSGSDREVKRIRDFFFLIFHLSFLEDFFTPVLEDFIDHFHVRSPLNRYPCLKWPLFI